MKQIIVFPIYLLFLSYKNKEVLANKSSDDSITPRIIGGANADIEVYSYTLILRYQGREFCTAFAISDVDIFSAAHCFTFHEELSPPYLEVTVHSGMTSVQQIGTTHEVARVTLHPEFTGKWKSALIHDIVHILLKEESKLTLDENQRTVGLPSQDIISGRIAILTGWGTLAPDTYVPAEQIQMLKMRIMDYRECQPQMERTLHKEQFCAVHSIGHGSGFGDSGAPLVYENEAIGILSWFRKGMSGAGFPEVFTNIYQEMGFIRSQMQRNPGGEIASSSSGQRCSPSQSYDMGEQIQGGSRKGKKSSWFRRLTRGRD